MGVLVTQVFNGLSVGSILLLAALGLALTFGQMGVINMAHGEFIMAGAYTAFVTNQILGSAGLSLLVSLPVAFVVAGLLGGWCRTAAWGVWPARLAVHGAPGFAETGTGGGCAEPLEERSGAPDAAVSPR